jgi:hypothetical protein
MSKLASHIELRFYDFDGTRRNQVLREARGISFTDELQGDGSASYRTSLLAQALQVDPDMLEGPGFCRAAIPLADGAAPTEVFAWELVPTSGTVVGEVDEQEVQCTAPGLRHLFEYAIVHAEGGAWDKTSEDERHFGWMSKENPLWYDASDWSTPLSHGFRKLLKNGQGAEKITADLTPAANDVYLFRTSITVTSSTPVLITWQADDEATLYVDSEVADTMTQANTSQSFVLGWTGPRTHTVAAEVRNTIGTECGLALMITNLTTGRVIRRTDTTAWKTHKVVSGVYPGMTLGAVLRILHNEANSTDQDVYALDHLLADFDGDVDSNGDAWPEQHDAIKMMTGSTTNGDAIRQLEELGCDVHIQPDGTFQAFISQGTDHSAACWLQRGSNLLRLDYAGQPVKGTKGIIRTIGGWLTRTNTAGVTAYGKRYTAITSGTSGSTSEGARLIDRALEETARPRYTYTATIRAVTNCVPWVNFTKGDLITCPDRVGTPTAMRVLSISASSSDDTPGPVLFTVELDLP